MFTAAFFTFLGIAVMVALFDWRRGWVLLLLCGVLQDPARKLTPGSPVYLTFSVVAVYGAILVSGYTILQQHRAEFSRRFPRVYLLSAILLLILILAAINGLVSYGLAYWKVPMLSLFTYLSPLPAVMIGYAYVNREEAMYRFLGIYALVTSVMLVGCLLEYFRIPSAALGVVSMPGDYIRHLPGVQIRMLSGFYRAPDVMAWHAATLTSIGLAMSVRAGISRSAFPWLAVTGWGFLNCLMSGRRKAIYFVISFVAVFLWRYFRRMQLAQIAAAALSVVVVSTIVMRLSSTEETSVYTRGATATQAEIFERVEGGLTHTFRQYGFMGAGLGAATQGVQHLLGNRASIGWQEGGLGKLAVELGMPGMVVLAVFGWVIFTLLLRLTSIRDVPGSPQILRVTLFALVAANVANFLGSAQAYTDPVLALMTMFFLGALFATAALDERVAQTPPPSTKPALAPVTA